MTMRCVRIVLAWVVWACLTACGADAPLTAETQTAEPVSTDLPNPTELPSPTPAPTDAPTSTPVPFGLNLEALPMQASEILYWRDSQLRIIGQDGSNDRLLLHDDHLTIGLPFASPSGRYLALSAMQPFVLDLQTGDVVPLSPYVDTALASFFWLPGDILYYIWKDEIS